MFSEVSRDQIKDLSSGLDVDETYVLETIQELGTKDAARIFGYKTEKPDYIELSGRLLMLSLQSSTPQNTEQYVRSIGHRLNDRVREFIVKHGKIFDHWITQTVHKDLMFDWFSGSTMIKTYLAKPQYDEDPCETPHWMYIRLAVQMYAEEGIEKVKKMFFELSEQYYTHASPTIFNAGMTKPQMSSCFLYMLDDNLESILLGLVEGGLISKASGGLGLDVSKIRHSKINTSGISSGIIPMLRLYNEMARYCDQGGKRKGALCAVNKPHHIDILSFIDIVKKTGDKDSRAHDINTSIWFSWLFWKRVRTQGTWTLFCPAHTPELNSLKGVDFENKYLYYEKEAILREKRYLELKDQLSLVEQKLTLEERKNTPDYLDLKEEFSKAKRNRINHKVIEAKDLLKSICQTQIQAGMPYVMHGDACWLKSNHRHLGDVTTNLCQEIVEHVSPKEIASCLPGDTLVVTADGVREIQDYEEGPLYTSFESEFVYEDKQEYIVSQRIFQGTKQVYLIKSKCGPYLRATKDHLLLCLDQNDDFQWVKVENLTLEHRLVISVNKLVESLDERSYEEGKSAKDVYQLWKNLINESLLTQISLVIGFLLTNGKQTKYDLIYSLEDRMLLNKLYLVLLSGGITSYILNDKLCISGASFKRLMNLTGMYVDLDVGEVPTWYTVGLESLPIYDGEEEVYDYYVPDKNHFIAQGVVVHNCNLASVSLKRFVKKPINHQKTFKNELIESYNFQELGKIVSSVTQNLNKVIDYNWYPLDNIELFKGKISDANKRHRPLGIGCSGFAEAVFGLDLTFQTEDGKINEKTKLLNKAIFACMYFNALVTSVELSLIHGPYESFKGSPFSEGKLQFDLWKEEFKLKGPNKLRVEEDDEPLDPSVWGQKEYRLENGDVVEPTWNDLKRCVIKYGTRNSLLLALMPTASTAQILGNTETVEAPLNNIYSRKVLNGAYPVLNKYLVNDLRKINCWNEQVLKYMVANNGSIKGLTLYIQQQLPVSKSLTREDVNVLKYLEVKYKTMYELKQGIFLRLAADRGRYIDQSQSTNIYLKDPSVEDLMALHLQTDMLGLKTGMYYLRQNPVEEAIKFTADTSILSYLKESKQHIQPTQNNELESEYCIGKDQNGNCISCQ